MGKANVNDGFMTWWSAKRFCAALGRQVATRASIGCNVKPGATCPTQKEGQIKSDFGSYLFWFNDEYSSCYAYGVSTKEGMLFYYFHDRNYYGPILALCQ